MIYKYDFFGLYFFFSTFAINIQTCNICYMKKFFLFVSVAFAMFWNGVQASCIYAMEFGIAWFQC